MQVIKWQFIRFIAMGGLAALVNFSSRVFYSNWMTFSSSVIAAYVTGMLVAFVLNSFFVFNLCNVPLYRSLLMFTLVNTAGVIQVWLVSIIFADYLLPFMGLENGTQELAHAIGIILPVFSSFFGHKYLSFKS
jgi:hypothetical protein